MRKINKIIPTVLSASILLTAVTGLNVTSAEEITVEIDGAPIEFDVEPQIIDGRTLVPLRKIFEEIGALVKWDEETRTVTARKGSKTVTLSVGSAELTVDKGKTDEDGNPVSETVTLDVPAQIVSGRTLVPVRAISESFGFGADWDAENRKVTVTSEEGDDSWKENTGTVNLSDKSFSGDGIEIDDNKIIITKGGDFTLTGELDGGMITVSAEEKVKLRLSGVKITCANDACIFIENADKAYITLTEGTENVLVSEAGEKGAVYSKDSLEVKGAGTLDIKSGVGHGIKANKNLTIENGNISIDAASDGIHVDDTFKMTGGVLDITAVGDGIDSESIVNISGGTIVIETTAVPVETEQTEDTRNVPQGAARENNTDVEFENSSKGIKAEWMIYISGGEFDVNSASHGLHCSDEIRIDGGNLCVSSKYEKGISAHGDVTIDGADTVIDIPKSTEGIESKNILTVNDGTIKVTASDDAINATGGNSGETGMPGGGFGGGHNFGGDRGQPGGMFGGEPREDGGENENRERGEKGRFDGKIPSDGAKTGTEPVNPFENEENGRFAPPDNNGAERIAPPTGDDGNERPDFANGEAPQMPGSEMQMPGGEVPQMPNGAGGGHGGREMKDCLIINGGYLELYAGDDCLDSNGNLVINGGVIKAVNPNGSFAGAYAVIDPDGETRISEEAVLIFAAGRGDEQGLNLSQNSITVYTSSSHGSNDKITVCDEDGSVMYEYTPGGSFSAVLISSLELELGRRYTVTVGEEKYEAELSEKSLVIGTRSGGFDGGRNVH